MDRVEEAEDKEAEEGRAEGKEKEEEWEEADGKEAEIVFAQPADTPCRINQEFHAAS